ncbi:hypothetical protein BV898_19242 [Hypsibius exemplaris]|uniref:Ubiquitin-like protease family profile domain-containing protein n=1 Tax=Hypsibius exemplaris TaxID=2072580 RepID=A0A9X6NRT8_HYPEX|nr:hypothetical protein BV898_19242 [Hypsibius exemplaris]
MFNMVPHVLMESIFKRLERNIYDEQCSTRTNFWCRPGGKLLGSFHKHLILEMDNEHNGWINGDIIYAGMLLLQKKYPFVTGFEHPGTYSLVAGREDYNTELHKMRVQNLINTRPSLFVPSRRPKVQILMIGGNHWVAIKTGPDDGHLVTVYDSLHMGVNSALAMQIAAVVRFPATVKSFSTISPPVCRQRNSKDCGVYATAFAAAAAAGDDPTNLYLADSKEIRNYLTEQLERGEAPDNFPTQENRAHTHRKRHSCEDLKMETWPIFCLCRTPNLPRKEDVLLTCGTGRNCFIKVYHESCIAYKDTKYAAFKTRHKLRDWICPGCYVRRKEITAMETMSIFFGEHRLLMKSQWSEWVTYGESYPGIPGSLTAEDIINEAVAAVKGRERELFDRLTKVPSLLLQLVRYDAWDQMCALTKQSPLQDRQMADHITWFNNRGRRLSYIQRAATMTEGDWLHDEVLDESQRLLQILCEKQAIGGLDPIANYTLTGGDFKVTITITHIFQLRNGIISTKSAATTSSHSKKIQVLHVGTGHWVTVSNVNSSEPNTVYCYDTLENVTQAPPNFDHLVASVFRFPQDTMKLVWPAMAYQPNGSDCGVYAIAIAEMLARNYDPIYSGALKLDISHRSSTISAKKTKTFPLLASSNT